MPSPGATTGRPRAVRSVLTGPRLLVALLLVLVVPIWLGVSALHYERPEAAPAVVPEQHAPLPQVPDSVAQAQIDRSAHANREARNLKAPALLSPSRTGSAATDLPTLALAPRSAPYTLTELRGLVPTAFADDDGALLVRAHIEVPVGAALVLDERTPDVRLLSTPHAFATLVSRGTTRVSGTGDALVQVSSWDPERHAPDSDSTDGRAFVLQTGGRMDVDHARFSSLGFGTGTTSGVAWRGASNAAGDRWVKVQGTVTDSVFAHNHFGAYTHQAQGMRLEGNVFAFNEEYGFDPHDYSDDLVVAGNTAHHNGKHGFIFSRGCDENVLRDNYAYANSGHGFMIDDGRSAQSAGAVSRLDPSDANAVVANVAYDNANSGVEIEGGTGNLVAGNRLSRNDIGVRVKDRASAAVRDNTIVGSDRYGVNVLDSAQGVPVAGNRISGSWAAINLEAAQSAEVGPNTISDVTTPLVTGGVVTYETTWVDEVAKYVRWNPVLVLWGLILGVPVLVGALQVLGAPFLRIGRRHARAS